MTIHVSVTVAINPAVFGRHSRRDPVLAVEQKIVDALHYLDGVVVERVAVRTEEDPCSTPSSTATP